MAAPACAFKWVSQYLCESHGQSKAWMESHQKLLTNKITLPLTKRSFAHYYNMSAVRRLFPETLCYCVTPLLFIFFCLAILKSLLRNVSKFPKSSKFRVFRRLTCSPSSLLTVRHNCEESCRRCWHQHLNTNGTMESGVPLFYPWLPTHVLFPQNRFLP